MKTIKKISLLVVLLGTLAGCQPNLNYRDNSTNKMVESRNGSYVIDQSISKGWFNDPVDLCTYIWHDGEIIKSWFDVPSDSIKCLRYNQAKALIDGYQHIDNLKCE